MYANSINLLKGGAKPFIIRSNVSKVDSQNKEKERE
jgi:hypothetical protein